MDISNILPNFIFMQVVCGTSPPSIYIEIWFTYPLLISSSISINIHTIRISYTMSAEQEKIIRPIANFPPSIWGDQFLVYDQVCKLIVIKNYTIVISSV
ncbi:putative amorpha-4,11-diene synthase [Helianthus debilis subsp. tardiflorus]